MPANHVYRLYSDVPNVVFDWLQAHVRHAVVRQLGRGIGTGGWFYMTVVLDDKVAAEQFEQWLDLRGQTGRLTIPLYSSDPSQVSHIENARWIARPHA